MELQEIKEIVKEIINAHKPIIHDMNNSHRENELLAQNQKLQQEIQQLKQIIHVLTAPGQTISNQVETDKQIKLEAVRKKAEAQRIRILEMQEEADLQKQIEEAEKEAVVILKMLEEEANKEKEEADLQRLIEEGEKEAVVILKMLENEENTKRVRKKQKNS
ncbi:hypothetical protein Q0590_36015 [Rhodocytophaga aerolata]|uniref:Uncharacterized protein n=1 Tax=Rhodocytophaga aerolata TaxID=455078 RepID=A0ABT8RJ14_9BACT|nr:hypothetical protein [Rhodocytophaga aerolata]MDO1451736.1 hypothetical protein [Rhodocytophaga aerolata]